MRIAICKGALFDPTVDLLAGVGLDTVDLKKATRQLLVKAGDRSVEYIICRPTDVPIVVEYGAADIGIVGKDVLLEQEKNVYELVDLKFGRCRLVLAEPEEPCSQNYIRFEQRRIATKFPNITRKYFIEKDVQVEIIKMHGNIELAPAIGLAEQIVDLTATGKTLKENRLKIVDEIGVCTSRLIANKASHKLKFDEINELVMLMKKRTKEKYGTS